MCVLKGCCLVHSCSHARTFTIGLAYQKLYRVMELLEDKDKQNELVTRMILLSTEDREFFHWYVKYMFHNHLRRTRICARLVAYTPRPLVPIEIRAMAKPFTPRLTKEQKKVAREFLDAYAVMNHGEESDEERMLGWKAIADGVESSRYPKHPPLRRIVTIQLAYIVAMRARIKHLLIGQWFL